MKLWNALVKISKGHASSGPSGKTESAGIRRELVQPSSARSSRHSDHPNLIFGAQRRPRRACAVSAGDCCLAPQCSVSALRCFLAALRQFQVAARRFAAVARHHAAVSRRFVAAALRRGCTLLPRGSPLLPCRSIVRPCFCHLRNSSNSALRSSGLRSLNAGLSRFMNDPNSATL